MSEETAKTNIFPEADTSLPYLPDQDVYTYHEPPVSVQLDWRPSISHSETMVPATSLPPIPSVREGSVRSLSALSHQSVSRTFYSWDDFPPLPGDKDAGPLAPRFWRYHIQILFGCSGTRKVRQLVGLVWKLTFHVGQVSAVRPRCVSVSVFYVTHHS